MLPGGGSKLVLFSARKTKTTHHLTPWTRLLVLGHAAARAALLMQNVSATSRMINFRYVLKQLNPKEQPLVIVSFFAFVFFYIHVLWQGKSFLAASSPAWHAFLRGCLGGGPYACPARTSLLSLSSNPSSQIQVVSASVSWWQRVANQAHPYTV